MGLFDNVVVTDVINTVTVTSHQGRRETITKRQHYGLSFCIDGKITYTHNGTEYVSDRSCAIVLPMGETYQLYGNKSGTFPVINFDTLLPLCNSHVVIPINDVSSFLSDYTLLRSCMNFDNDRAKAMSIFYNIIHKLSENRNTSGIITPAIEYIKSNYTSAQISNDYLAKLCNISEVYFRRLFTKIYKMTPKQYIIELRITKAKELLSEGNLKILAVSEKCGFTNPYHFDRLFKERVGSTPGEYMRNNMAYKI